MKTAEYIKEIHRNTDGFITFFRKLKDGVKQYHYKLDEINDAMLNEWITYDSYVSLNSFFVPKRGIQTLRTLHNLYVDIDCYTVNMTPEQVVMSLEADHYGITIPTPSIVTYSGRGVQLVWNIEGMSGLAIERWDALQRALHGVLKPFGADIQALDAARVFRLAGSINSKNGAIVHCERVSDYEYSYSEIIDGYFANLKQSNRAVAQPHRRPSKRKVLFTFNSYTLAQSRLNDIKTLVELRKGEVSGHRERILFLARLNALRITNSDYAAVAKMREINGLFSQPLNEAELLKATASAIEYHKQGGLNMRNGVYIEWLGITPVEQEAMSTLINRKEKQARDRRRKQKAHKQAGKQSMAEYNAKRRRQLLRQVKRVNLAQAIYPTYSIRELAERVELSKSHVGNLLKMADCEQSEKVSTDRSALVKREFPMRATGAHVTINLSESISRKAVFNDDRTSDVT